MPRPNDGEFRRFSRYVLARAVDLQLRDWDLELKRGTTDDGMSSDALAQVEVNLRRRYACVMFADTFWDRPERERRHVVAHELLHIHLWPMMVPVRDAEPLIGLATAQPIEDAMENANEQACDAIAKAVAEHWPPVPS